MGYFSDARATYRSRWTALLRRLPEPAPPPPELSPLEVETEALIERSRAARDRGSQQWDSLFFSAILAFNTLATFAGVAYTITAAGLSGFYWWGLGFIAVGGLLSITIILRELRKNRQLMKEYFRRFNAESDALRVKLKAEIAELKAEAA